jgi:hypothetical protein
VCEKLAVQMKGGWVGSGGAAEVQAPDHPVKETAKPNMKSSHLFCPWTLQWHPVPWTRGLISCGVYRSLLNIIDLLLYRCVDTYIQNIKIVPENFKCLSLNAIL